MKNLILTFAAVCVVVAAGCSQMQPAAPSSPAVTTDSVAYWPPGPQGCTPGYWKQEQHFDSWPAGYTPNMLFADLPEIADAFPGLTLLQVLELKGGGLNAFGRHFVAALLNSASGFGLDLATLQFAFGFYDGPNVEQVKNNLEQWNEAGCPLN